MRLVLTFLMISLRLALLSQTIYLFPGQGTDRRIFDSLSIDPKYEVRIIEYVSPDKGMTMNTFAKQLSVQIDTTEEFILVGVSLGGMLCVELDEILNPSKTIIISSAKNFNELPFRYKFQKKIPLYKLFPPRMILAGAKILQPIVEPDRNKNKSTFKSMLGSKNRVFMKRSVGLIINWSRTTNNSSIYHIHGTKDHTLPIRKIKSPMYIVDKGSHMMTLTRAKEISFLLNSILQE